MYRLMLKLVGLLVVAGVVWWRMEGKPLPGFLSGDDEAPSGLVYGPDGEIDMSQVYGSRIDAPADAAAIVFSQIGQIMEQTQQAAETAALRQARGCSFSTLPDMSDCPEPPAGAEPHRQVEIPTVISGRGSGSAGSSGVVVVRPNR